MTQTMKINEERHGVVANRVFGGRSGWAAIAALLFFLGFAQHAHGASFEPTRFDDPAPNGCRPANCSLREAIDAANRDSDRDTILLARGTYEIERAHVPDSDYNATGDLAPSEPVTIKGRGPTATKVDANGLDRVFAVASIMADEPVKFQSLMVKGGDPESVSDPQHVSVGGGIYAYTKHVVLRNVAIRRNEAPAGGGARLQVTQLKIRNSTISRNAATAGGGVQFPAAIYETPVADIKKTTISGNSASRAAGVLVDGARPMPSSLEVPQVSFANSTIAGNTASAEGGGIVGGNEARVSLDNSTVAHNIADVDNTGGGYGGGVYQHNGAAFELGDSVIGANTVGTSGNGRQCAGAFMGAGGNLIQLQPGTACAISGSITEPEEPLLGPLGSNGGPTQTVDLLTGSPASGLATSCPPTDQRDMPRPPTACDSGAFEREGP